MKLIPSRTLALGLALIACSGVQPVLAQAQRFTRAITVEAEEEQQVYTFTQALPRGVRAADVEFAVTDTEGRTLPSFRGASAKTYLAHGEPELHAKLTFAGVDEEVEASVAVSYREARSASLGARNAPSEPTTSVLAEGDVYKLSINEDGIYVIDAELLDQLGVGTSGLDPGTVRLYSKGGAALPELVGTAYPTDLQEVGLLELGNGNDVWDGDDRLLFYGQGEDVWRYDSLTQNFERKENLYAEATNYYLKVGGDGKRVATAPEVLAQAYDDVYSNRARWEEDLYNLLDYSKQNFGSGQGSGQDWYGTLFSINRELTRENLFDLGDIVAGATGRLTASMAASSTSGGSRFEVTANGQSFMSSSIRAGVRRNANNALAHYGSVDAPLTLERGKVDITVSYPGNAETRLGWLDYVQVVYPARLAYGDEPLFFRSLGHADAGTHGFSLATGRPDLTVLDVSDPLSPRAVPTSATAAGLRFGYVSGGGAPAEFVAFEPGRGVRRPTFVEQVPNSNLHGIRAADMIIVYGEGLEESAERLAQHRRDHDGFIVEAVDVRQVLEEFGGGRPDPTAIRELTRMVYERYVDLRYLLLLGDSSFDPRDIKGLGGNLVPAYQTKPSNWEVTAFPTDDYYVLLDETEGRPDTGRFPEGGLDVAVGRIPASNPAQANRLVEKIIRYDSSPELLGDWRLRTVFVADNGDSNGHLNDVDGIAVNNGDRFPDFNQVKVYADAFELVPTPGGTRIPDAAKAITQNMFRGNLVTTYLGHGGPRGWAQERILNAPDIENWNNDEAYTVLVTATCTFTGYDDPERTVAGEQVIFKANGGAVASLSTVRPVYITSNRVLAEETHRRLLDDSLALRLGLGELLVLAKGSRDSGREENDRKYALFGDPATRLAVPELEVELLSIDSVDLAAATDTVVVRPLKAVTVSGVVNELDGRLADDFTGTLDLTVFDKPRERRTLGQGSNPVNFTTQASVLFKGRASVTNGRWTAKFILPKDVSLGSGFGRLSLYVSSPEGRDGSGHFDRFIVDGRGASGVTDDTPPVVEVYFGDEEFVSGGVVSRDPVLFAKLSDDTGINVSDAVIGHGLTASLRGVESEEFVLNDFYRAEKDDFTRGEVRYPIFELEDGEYELELRAWDLANNTATGSTAFVVAEDAGTALRRVLNYPNPFVDATCFQFEHSSAGRPVTVQIDIYTVSGRLVNSIRHETVPTGFRFGNDDCISWDGTDRYGQRLARGAYLYRVKLMNEDDGETVESDFEKLVVLR